MKYATRCLAPFVVLLAGCSGPPTGGVEAPRLPRADGYRGIWYSNQPSGDRYRFKYAGGFATYPQQHVPIAVYCPAARKTFFVYGGVDADGSLLHMVSYFDHTTGRVPRPVVLLDKDTKDAHDNPTLAVDGRGYLWVFSNAHGTSRPSYVHRSLAPYSIDGFERVRTTNFSYGQPWWVPGQGFCFLHTRYERGGRSLYVERSADGRTWSEPQLLARAARGHYQISWRRGTTVGTAFNVHPREGGLNARTNLYYAATHDSGATWTDAGGAPLELPLATIDNPALVRDYRSERLLVYLKDLAFDCEGRPVILYLTSRGYASGPNNDPRLWHTAHWTGSAWRVREITSSDHNYDFGSLYVEADGTWRVIATTGPGPQPYGTGGEVAVWISRDEGARWTKSADVTTRSERNHTYVRRPFGAQPDFYALWADGDAFAASPSDLYYTDRGGDRVFRLPAQVPGTTTRPDRVR